MDGHWSDQKNNSNKTALYLIWTVLFKAKLTQHRPLSSSKSVHFQLTEIKNRQIRFFKRKIFDFCKISFAQIEIELNLKLQVVIRLTLR